MVYTLWYGCGLFSLKLYLMVKISLYELDVVWMWLFSQMAVPDGVQVVLI